MTGDADLRAFLTRPATAARGIDAMQWLLPRAQRRRVPQHLHRERRPLRDRGRRASARARGGPRGRVGAARPGGVVPLVRAQAPGVAVKHADPQVEALARIFALLARHAATQQEGKRAA